MKITRIIVAAVTLTALTLLFVVPCAGFCAWLGWFPRLQLVPAVLAGEVAVLVAIAVSVALCGRLYCSVICPLGIVQDLAGRIFRLVGLGRKAPAGRPGPVGRTVRYAVLALFVAGAAFGYTGIIAPYGIFGRFLSAGVMRFGEPAVLLTCWAIGLFAFIMVMTAFRARWWCNQVCPVGTFLGIFSRFALFRPRIDGTACVGCGACAKACDKGAIFKDGKKVAVDPSRCVACFNCKGSCHKGALKWR